MSSTSTQTSKNANGGIPFTFLCSFYREISLLKPHSAAQSHRAFGSDQMSHPALETFKRWRKALYDKFSPLPKGTSAACFRLLFPEEDTKRKYDMQEPRLIQALSTCLPQAAEPSKFGQWDAVNSSGCLGDEVRIILRQVAPTTDIWVGPLSIAEVDELLNELAASSGYSDISIRNQYSKERRRPRISILQDLYRDMNSEDASYLTQIILKDLRPILYPLPDRHYTAALKNFNTNSIRTLSLDDAMRAWDPSGQLMRAYRIASSFDFAGGYFELPCAERHDLKPENGVPIQVPKSSKGHSCSQALDILRCSSKVWAETKYDGERAQIHVKLLDDGTPWIKIFSKSKRDSTNDRHELHQIILDALDYRSVKSRPFNQRRALQNVILDAEMVAFSSGKVAEFWRIRRLIENTAYGIRHVVRNQDDKYSLENNSQVSILSDDSDDYHLGLVFFDVMMLDSASLLATPYNERRGLLESLIHQIPGKAILAKRWPIDVKMGKGTSALRKIFSQHIADHQEGLVLKSDESQYNDDRLPWVKLKKDYIPGYGDSIDLILAGASWEKSRGRELRVAPGTFTTFYIGALKRDYETVESNSKPHIEVFFTVSYGLTRDQLEDLNFQIKASDCHSYPLKKTSNPLPYTFSVFSGLQSFPTVILRSPLLIELFGAGFTKAPRSSVIQTIRLISLTLNLIQYYEPRFPRLTKVHRTSERNWTDGLDLRALHDIACTSVGRDRSDKDIDNWAKNLFGKSTSPGIKCPLKRKAISEEWEEKLSALDRKHLQTSIIRSSFYDNSRTPHRGADHAIEVILGPLSGMTNLEPTLMAESHQVEGVKSSGPPSSAQTTDRISSPNSLPFQSLSQHSSHTSNWPLTKASNLETRTTTNPPSLTHDIPFEIFKNCFVWFAQSSHLSGSMCTIYFTLKKKIPREQRIHSFESLLIGCGWDDQKEGRVGQMRQGTIIVDDHNVGCNGRLASIIKKLDARRSSLKIKGDRKTVSVFSCKALASGCRDPLYQLN